MRRASPRGVMLFVAPGTGEGDRYLTHIRAELAARVGPVTSRQLDLADFDWTTTDHNWIAPLVESPVKFILVVLFGFSPGQLDLMFRLRFEQLRQRRRTRPVASIAITHSGPSVPGLANRIASSWPFRSLTLLRYGMKLPRWIDETSPAPTTHVSVGRFAQSLGSGGCASILSAASARQPIAVQIQPMWGRCGSSTVFANQIDALTARGYFVIRVFIDHNFRRGGTLQHRLPRLIEENRLEAAPHLETASVPDWAYPEYTNERPGAYEDFARTVATRALCTTGEPGIDGVIARARIAIVNHAMNIGYAKRACRQARILLETHDNLTRNAYLRALRGSDEPSFSSRRELLRMARLEARLWATADLCVNLNESEHRWIVRFNPRSVIQLPTPYVRCSDRSNTDADWDLLLVGDQNANNIDSIRWFLDRVVLPHPDMARSRIAIAGRVSAHIDTRHYESRSGVRFLGFVNDLDTLRERSWISVAPDQGGTGIAIKVLTTLAAGHPLVCTPASLRGLHRSILRHLPACGDAPGMVADLRRLMRDTAAITARRAAGRRAYAAIRRRWSYEKVLDALCAGRPRRAGVIDDPVTELVTAWDPRPNGAARRVPEDGVFQFAAGRTAEPFLVSGWHAGEVWGRWMDGSVAIMRLPLQADAGHSEVQLELMAPDTPITVSIEMDGNEASKYVIDKSQRRSIVLAIPMASRRRRMIEFTVRADRVFCGSEHDPKGDQRVLGAGVCTVQFVPRDLPQATVTVDMGDESASAFLGMGWHAAESWGRWMNGSKAVMRLPLPSLPRRPLRLAIDMDGHADGGTLAVTINDESVTKHSRNAKSQAWLIPVQMQGQRRFLKLGLATDRCYRPSDHGVFDDTRLLGSAIRSVSLAAIPDYVPGAVINLSDAAADAFLGQGWQAREEWGRWMDGPDAELLIPLGQARMHRLRLVADVNSESQNARLNATVNGHVLPWVNPVFGRCQWLLPLGATSAATALHIEFHTSSRRCPAGTGSYDDSRHLGTGLRQVSVDPAVDWQRRR